MARSTRLSVSMKVVPSHEVIHLAYLYTRAKQRVLDWLVENKPHFKSDKDLLNIIHHEWHEKLKEMGLHHV